MIKQKSFIFVMTLMVLLIGLTAISAADTGNNTASSVISDNTISADTISVGSIASTVSDTKTVKSEAKTITKTNSEKLVSDTTKKTIKSNMKNTKKTNSEITVNNDNFQDRETLSNITPCNHTHDTNIRKSKSLKREDIEWYEITITKDNYLTYLRERVVLFHFQLLKIIHILEFI